MAQAGLNGSVSLFTENDSNLFRSAVEEDGVASRSEVRLGYSWMQEEWSESIVFERSDHFFSTDPDMNYTLGSMKAFFMWSSEDERQFHASLGVENRVDREEYAIYEYDALTATVDGSFRVGSRGSVKFGYAYENREYAAQELYDSIENRLFAHTAIPAGNAMTITIANEVGFKSWPQLSTQTVTGRGGRGRVVQEEGPVAAQWRGSVRLSLPLADNTGFRLELLRSLNIGEAVDYSALLADNYLAGDVLYDDPYAYERREFNVQLSQRFSPDLIVRLSGNLAYKDYQQDALDLEGSPVPGAGIRNDRQERVMARVEKSWKNQRKTIGVKLYLQALYLRNHSDDLLYDYSATSASAGLGVEF